MLQWISISSKNIWVVRGKWGGLKASEGHSPLGHSSVPTNLPSLPPSSASGHCGSGTSAGLPTRPPFKAGFPACPSPRGAPLGQMVDKVAAGAATGGYKSSYSWLGSLRGDWGELGCHRGSCGLGQLNSCMDNQGWLDSCKSGRRWLKRCSSDYGQLPSSKRWQ